MPIAGLRLRWSVLRLGPGRGPADDGGQHVEVVAQMHEVGSQPGRKCATLVRHTQSLGRIERRHAQGLFEWHLKGAVHVGDGLDHGQVCPGQRAIGEPERAVLAIDSLAGENEALRIGTGWRHGVGDEEDMTGAALGAKGRCLFFFLKLKKVPLYLLLLIFQHLSL